MKFVKQGVPQVQFWDSHCLLFVNDITNGKLVLYADDTTTVSVGINEQCAISNNFI